MPSAAAACSNHSRCNNASASRNRSRKPETKASAGLPSTVTSRGRENRGAWRASPSRSRRPTSATRRNDPSPYRTRRDQGEFVPRREPLAVRLGEPTVASSAAPRRDGRAAGDSRDGSSRREAAICAPSSASAPSNPIPGRGGVYARLAAYQSAKSFGAVKQRRRRTVMIDVRGRPT